MPALPQWIDRLPQILTELQALESAHLDRRTVEKLFDVKESRARQLMAGLPGFHVGTAATVERIALIRRIEEIAAGDQVQHEAARRRRLAEDLERTRKVLAARAVELDVAPGVGYTVVETLGPGIDVRSGELRIAFTSPVELASKLFELSQAMANDWDAFAKKVGG